MLKKIAIGVALVAVLAWGLYAFAGFRVAVDGSGMWPRFVFRPNDSALEADRARQRQQTTPPTAVAPESTSPTSAAVGGAARRPTAAARIEKVSAKVLKMNFI